MRRLAVLALAAALASGCTGSDDAGSSDTVGCKVAANGRVTLVADDLRWDTACLRSGPGPLAIVVDNRDDGENHNIHLPTAEGSPATDLEQGPSRQQLDVDLTPGAYEFVCDIHPNMVGTLTVR